VVNELNSTKHCKISVRRYGGVEDDYRSIHDFIDSTKVLCAGSRHRIFHTTWAVNLVVVPIFGHTIINSDNAEVDVKDLCERDHLLVDYANKFIPTLNDFMSAVSIDLSDEVKRIEIYQHSIRKNTELCKLLLSPLDVTGRIESLLLTHNRWFAENVVNKIFGFKNTVISESLFPPDLIFKHMRFESWMDNGLTYPPSASKLQVMTTRRKS